MHDGKPLVIAVEGTDYSGKSTAVEEIRALLAEYKVPKVVHFPTADGYGKQARTLWASGAPADETARVMVANMKDEQGRIPTDIDFVIFDRYLPSTVALQGECALDIAIEQGLGDSDFTPDIYFVLHIPYLIAKRRSQDRAEEWDDHRTAPALESVETWDEYTSRCIKAVHTVAGKLPTAKKPVVIELEYREGENLATLVRKEIERLSI